MPKSAKTDITPKNGWRFMALSILPEFGTDSLHSSFGTDTVSLGTRALEEGVRHVALSVPEDNRFVEVVPFPSEIIYGMPGNILHRAMHMIYEQGEKAEKDGRQLILGLSVWSEQQSLDIMHLLAFAREASGGTFVTVVGGPGLSAPSPGLEAGLIAAGADIINIGGGKELAEWLGRLTKEDRFFRDADGTLIATLPEKMPFFLSSSKTNSSGAGNALPASVWYAPLENAIFVNLPGNGCVNRCDFCAVAKSLARPQVLAKQELIAQINALAAQTNAIIEKVNAGETKNAPETLLRVDISNPNPMQGLGPEILDYFFSKIDMTKPIKLGFFLDALSFRTEEGMKRQTNYLANLLTQHKNLKIQAMVSVDALQEKDDGDFMGRRIAGRLVSQDEYEAIRRNLRLFLEDSVEKEWSNRLLMQCHQIIHPAMTADVYRLKSDLENIALSIVQICHEYPLMVYDGAPLSERNNGHYAPRHIMEKEWELGYALHTDRLSCWGNQFKNGDLLDCVVVLRYMREVMADDIPGVLLDALVAGWDDGKAKLCTHPFDGIEDGRELEEKIIKSAQKMLDKKQPRITSVLKPYVDLICDKDSKGDKDFSLALAVHGVVSGLLNRERYLAETNPDYANNPKCQNLIKSSEEMEKRLRSTAYAKNFDLRPKRIFTLSDKAENFGPI